MSWTEERVKALKKLWADGLTASKVAGELGGFEHLKDKGRSAVIGKVHRLGIDKRANVPRRPLSQKQKQALEKGRAFFKFKGSKTTKKRAARARKSKELSCPPTQSQEKPNFISAKKKREMGFTDPEDGFGQKGSSFPKPDKDLPLETLQYLERHLY